MKLIRKRLTYANVMSSIAVFLILGGATAFAAKKIGSNQIKGNSITTGKIKKEAVTTSKIKKNAISTAKIANGAVTGPKINVGSLGTVPNATHATTADTATTAITANSVAGRTPFSFFMPAGTRDIATVAPFTVRAVCRINNGGEDEGEMQVLTSVNGAAMDDNNGDEFVPFDVSDNPAQLYSENTTTGNDDIEVGESPGLTAVAPNGATVVTQNETIGFNIAGHPGQCFFAGLVVKVG